jgi:hypothetical protein
VRRATHPSTASSTSATAASVTSSATGVLWVNESAASAATPTASVARASVTRDAGPSRSPGSRVRPRASAVAMVTAQAMPTVQPTSPSPAVPARTASSSIWAINPVAGPV